MALDRFQLVLLNTLTNARITQLQGTGACIGDDQLAQSNRRYLGDLTNLAEAVEKEIDTLDRAQLALMPQSSS